MRLLRGALGQAGIGGLRGPGSLTQTAFDIRQAVGPNMRYQDQPGASGETVFPGKRCQDPVTRLPMNRIPQTRYARMNAGPPWGHFLVSQNETRAVDRAAASDLAATTTSPRRLCQTHCDQGWHA